MIGVYLAANFAARVQLRQFRDQINKTGVLRVTSNWLDVPTDLKLRNSTRKQDADIDKKDMENADFMIFYADQIGWTPGRGKYWELGFFTSIRGQENVFVISANKEQAIADMVFLALYDNWFSTEQEVFKYIEKAYL